MAIPGMKSFRQLMYYFTDRATLSFYIISSFACWLHMSIGKAGFRLDIVSSQKKYTSFRSRVVASGACLYPEEEM